jgi:3-hydroxyisobutyrate dehydrogenase-like beta-hydroxyacid dehydrogenase
LVILAALADAKGVAHVIKTIGFIGLGLMGSALTKNFMAEGFAPSWVRSGMSPGGGADPETVVPLAVTLAAQTAERPNGDVLKAGNPEIR